jgi:hypothetical protein
MASGRTASAGGGPRGVGRVVTRPIVVGLVVAALLLTACGGSKYRYVTSKSPELVYKLNVGTQIVRVGVEAADTYYRVPKDWAVFDENEVLAEVANARKLSPLSLADLAAEQHVSGFDASPEPSASNVFGSTVAPSGRQLLLVLDDEARDNTSLRALRGLFVDIDEEIEQAKKDNVAPKVKVHGRTDDVVRPGGFHGSQVIFDYVGEDAVLTFNQTTLFDSESRVAYLFIIGCEANCYVNNYEAINDVVESWTIKEHK